MIVPPVPPIAVAKILLGLTLVLAGAVGGAVVNGWRLDAAHQVVLAEKEQKITDLDKHLTEQNAGIALLDEKTQSAESRRKTAEQFAAAALQRAGARSQAVANSTATNCDGVLKEAWGGW